MTAIKDNKNSIVFENDRAVITLSKKDSSVEEIVDKKTGKSIKGEDTKFFSFYTKEKEEIALTGISVKGDVITVSSEKGSFDVKVAVFDNYFTFEIISKAPEGMFKIIMGHMKFDYDYLDKKNTGANGVAMTIWVNPMFYPDAKSRETRGEVFPHLGDVGAKLGIAIAPIIEQNAVLKELFLTIDPEKGIVSKTGGVWGIDSRLNYGNYIIQLESSEEFIDKNLEYYKALGVDQIPFHHCDATFRQGDFKFMRYKDANEFKEKVSDKLAAHGIATGLHTYSFYINFGCDTILSKPEYQKQLKVMGEYTLAEDISADADFLKILEDTSVIPTDRGFCRTNSPLLLVGEEIIYFGIRPNGLAAIHRGWAGTKAAAHKKGDVVKHIEGHYNGVTPIFGSELFYKIARDTAKAYNESGCKMIYLDALDGARFHCDKESEYWFYKTAFAHEVLKNCHDYPILEGADYGAAMYATRGRIGAWDYAFRGYKGYTDMHAKDNSNCTDKFLAATLGWYSFYPMSDMYPGNEHTKYHHTDSIDYLGATAVMYDYSNVFNGTKATFERYAGLRRNITLYKKYDDLRKAQYFSPEYRQKLLDGKWEYQLKEKRGGKYTFVEKDYQFAKLYDLSDCDRNVGEFKNPFGAQVPFIRIEAMMSTLKLNPMVMMKLDENVDLTSQKLEVKYGTEINFKENLAKVVRVKGNGIKGGKIAINVRCATNSETGYGEYIIDTDFKGWREFMLLESDNGERRDHHFEEGLHHYNIYRSSLNNDRTTGVDIMTEGDMTGVRMSSIIAYEHIYEVLKNPTVKIGEGSVTFECELQSTDFIEFDGKTAKVIDRFGNERPIWFNAENFKAPRGKFKAELTARALNRTTPRAKLTLGFTGKEVK